MKVLVVTPIAASERTGNRRTAARYAGILERLGHEATIAPAFLRGGADVLVALHAIKSHDSIERFARAHPHRPIVVVLTGTDLYGPGRQDPAFEQSVDRAARVVVLQPAALDVLPERARSKARVIVQSAAAPLAHAQEPHEGFVALLVGHLRAVKDPLLCAQAARLVPRESRLRVVHVGAALEPELEDAARREMRENPRYLWLGERPDAGLERLYASADVFVLTSRSEGGSLALIEAVVHGLPCLATRVAGNVGLLGADHPGLFEAGDAAALADLLVACEGDAAFLARLEERSLELAPRFAPAVEGEAWSALLAELAPGG